MICDQEGKILQINAAALNLFALSSERLCLGKPYQQFLESYKRHDEQQQSASPEPWLLCLILGEGAPSSSQEEVMTLQIPSGRQVYVDMRCSPLLDTSQHDVGTLVILRDITQQYQKALRLQHVHEALLILRETIVCLPASRDSGEPLTDLGSHAENVLLSPPVLFIAQQLVDLICGVLGGQKVSLLASVPPASQLSYIAGSGFTSKQEQHRWEIRGRFFPLGLS
jgi:PAS domain S-box-containing protein